MVRMSLYRKLIARLLVLVYLLVGIGISNNLLWCQDAQASHVEYNPMGKCRVDQSDCLSADERFSTEGQRSLSLILATSPADCLDTTTSSSHALSLKSKDLLATPQVADWPAFLLVPRIGSIFASLTVLNLAAQPPPSQAHNALRTIVLLH